MEEKMLSFYNLLQVKSEEGPLCKLQGAKNNHIPWSELSAGHCFIAILRKTGIPAEIGI